MGAALSLDNAYTCGIATLVTILAFWSINFIAAELEMPFGDHPNDLPMGELQVVFNTSLRRLMSPPVQSYPTFVMTADSRVMDMEDERMATVENHYRTGTYAPQPPGNLPTIIGKKQNWNSSNGIVSGDAGE